MQRREHTAQTTKTIPVECIRFPMPTKGETTPPKAKETDPSNADALPEYIRPLSIASVVEEVKQSPNEKRIQSINTSYTQKLHPANKATISHTEKTSNPILPASVPFSTRLNFTANAAAITTASALTPKQILKSSGVNP